MSWQTILARWLSRISPEPNSGCWLWLGSYNDRYGAAHDPDKQQMRPAHRVIYEALIGPVPQGMELDHRCRVLTCVNPAHLEPVTHRENLMRGIGFYALNARKTHCPQGHAYTPENTIPVWGGGRRCRTCTKMRAAAQRRGVHEHMCGEHDLRWRCEDSPCVKHEFIRCPDLPHTWTLGDHQRQYRDGKYSLAARQTS